VQAIEEAADVQVPERALFIRSMVGELERIHSHLLWLGLAGHFLGFNTIWMWAWRFREDVLNILELISGISRGPTFQPSISCSMACRIR